ncbi:MAG TPA: trypsin-like peptidase domain-containing protein [Candidatus Acidoferrum sp.]|nr:trypsin-like peptidase domain-containing protein [Candidatus Acidoferrum sp.]
MFYDKDDLDFYENEYDATPYMHRPKEPDAPVPAAPEEPEAPQKKRGLRGPFMRFAANAVAAALISVGSIAGYSAYTGQGAQPKDVRQVVYEPVSYGNTLTVPQIIEAAKPSVVSVICTGRYQQTLGSGVIMTEDGKIITNNHVIEGATTITVRLSDGTEYEATVLGADRPTDLAVLQIKADGLKAAAFGDSDKLIQGEIAVAIGSPLGLEFEGSSTQGIISATSRTIEVDGRTMELIQTDAAINPGNSGGALVNGNGEVIGINSVKIVSSDTEGLGFAIPTNLALPIAEQLIDNGYVTGRPSIGITVEDISAMEAQFYRVPQGPLVQLVDPSSGAAKAGIQAGDIITAIDGKTVTSYAELESAKQTYEPGDTVTISVYRNGSTLDFKVTLDESVGN